MVFEIQGWSKIFLRPRKGTRPIGEIGVIPPTRIVSAREWVIDRPRVISVNVVN